MSTDRPTEVAARVRQIASMLDGVAEGIAAGDADPETLDAAVAQLRRLRHRTFGRSPGWHRTVVGGDARVWERNAERQFSFMVRAGLEPGHFLLDIGCGSLRAGTRLIPYLDAGHYFGVDRNRRLIEAGLAEEISPETRREKRPQLVVMEDFGFEQLAQRFDYAMALYLFQDLPLNKIMRCLVGVARVLKPGGRFYASVFENPDQRNLAPIDRAMGQSFYDARPFHYDLETLACACRGAGLELGEAPHGPSLGGQRMVSFSAPAA